MNSKCSNLTRQKLLRSFCKYCLVNFTKEHYRKSTIFWNEQVYTVATVLCFAPASELGVRSAGLSLEPTRDFLSVLFYSSYCTISASVRP